MWKVVEVKYESLYYQNSGTIINVSEFGCNEHKHVLQSQTVHVGSGNDKRTVDWYIKYDWSIQIQKVMNFLRKILEVLIRGIAI